MQKLQDLFLFEYVPQNKKIVIYGLGVVVESYIGQIEKTHWCDIVGVCDQSEKSSKYKNYPIEQLAVIDIYDYIVIAIQSLETASKVYENLVKLGVKKDKILNMHLRQETFPLPSVRSTLPENTKLEIAVRDGGGFGDLLIDYLLIQKIKEIIAAECTISLFSKYADYFRSFPKINESLMLEDFKRNNHFDVVICCHNIPIIEKFNKNRVIEKSKRFYEYCDRYEDMYTNLFSQNANNYRFTKYALLLGKNRIEQLDIYGVLGLTRKERIQIPIARKDLACLDKYNLQDVVYITINRDTGTDFDGHPKLWPIAYYIELLKLIKTAHSDIMLVLVGSDSEERLMPYVDMDLTGKTTLSEMNVILKYAFLHIGNEGGMVHLRHFLFGKSLVFWGATDVRVFGYEENINLFSKSCAEHCEWLVDNWMEGCIKKEERYSCVKSVLPGTAWEAVREYIKQEEQWVTRLLPYKREEDCGYNKREGFTYHMPYYSNECKEQMLIEVKSEGEAEYLLREAVRILNPQGTFLIYFERDIDVYKLASELKIEIDMANSDDGTEWILQKEAVQ